MPAPANTEIVLHEHPIMWFPDGDVVLSLNTSEEARTLYRLDKSLLAHHSGLFRDTFKLPYRPGVNEEYQGVPVVKLDESDPDAAEDLLKFIHNPAYVSSHASHDVL